MAQEFTINSANIESKINQLLPSQGGFGAGVDFSASTMVIPIVDLTETAEGSNIRQDLQSALSLGSVTAFNVSNTTTTIINTTGYFRIYGLTSFIGAGGFIIQATDGTTTKILTAATTAGTESVTSFDFIVFLQAGDSIQVNAFNANVSVTGCSRQLADISGNLVNPI